MLPRKIKCYKKSFFDFSLFWPFLTKKTAKKQPKSTQNEENWPNPNRLMKFSEIWYVDASQQKKMLQINYFSMLAFLGLFLAKKQPKLIKKEENWQNPNCLITFSEIWQVNASQQKKKKKIDFGLFWPKKTAKIDQKLRKLAESKSFNKIL